MNRKKNRRSSFEAYATSDSNAVLRAMEGRIIKSAAARESLEHEDDELGADADVEAVDQMEPEAIDLLNMTPDDRPSQTVESIVQLLNKKAGKFMSTLSDAQQTEVGRSCLYHYFQPEELVCDAYEETTFFFVVLHGSVDLEEKQVHHQEGALGGEKETSQMRNSTINAGGAFHHFPLVMGQRFYEYSARVNAKTGASILFIRKDDYIVGSECSSLHTLPLTLSRH
jgi:hypothetical protein